MYTNILFTIIHNSKFKDHIAWKDLITREVYFLEHCGDCKMPASTLLRKAMTMFKQCVLHPVSLKDTFVPKYFCDNFVIQGNSHRKCLYNQLRRCDVLFFLRI